MDLSGHVVLITGGGSGIGRATAQHCGRAGATVAVVDRDVDGARATATMIGDDGGEAIALTADVSDEAAVAAAVDRAVAAFGRLDGLVTAAGIFDAADLGRVEDVTLETFNRVLSINLAGSFLAAKHALPHLRVGGGAIVFVASTAAIRGSQAGPGYTSSKGGVDALSRLVASQYGADGVRANTVLPGGVDTPMTAGVLATPEAQARARGSIPLQRYAVADDIAQTIAYLLSGEAGYLTGQSIVLDGGASIQ